MIKNNSKKQNKNPHFKKYKDGNMPMDMNAFLKILDKACKKNKNIKGN